MVILTPDGVALMLVFAVGWCVEGVVCSDNHYEQPCNDGQDLVGDEIAPTEFFAFGEGVVCLRVSRPFRQMDPLLTILDWHICFLA